jgi:hypothetical protein
MLKFLLAMTLGVLVAATSSAQTDARVFELRTYTASPEKLDELHTRFRDHTIRLLEKHGATNVGYWVPADNADGKIVFLLSYPSQAARDRTWSNLVADPEWLRAKRTSERQEGKLVERIESTFLTPTEYSPAIRAARDANAREFELRTATGKAQELHAKMRSETLPELERSSTAVLGVWTVRSASGADTTVMYLVARKPTVGEADSTIVSLRGVGMRRPAPRPDPSVLSLRATDYSPMK